MILDNIFLIVYCAPKKKTFRDLMVGIDDTLPSYLSIMACAALEFNPDRFTDKRLHKYSPRPVHLPAFQHQSVCPLSQNRYYFVDPM
jgi:hypothetical protein